MTLSENKRLVYTSIQAATESNRHKTSIRRVIDYLSANQGEMTIEEFKEAYESLLMDGRIYEPERGTVAHI